jgi:UDP:flavonoid glycosyltransferase YjiC (YdhE family)
MGHLIPIIHIAEELASRGHDVTVISNQLGQEKGSKMVIEAGCKPCFTQDGITRGQMSPGIDTKANPNSYVGFGMWKPFIKEELTKLKPDIAVIDFFTVPAFLVCDELGIKVVSNMSFPLNIMNSFGVNFPNKENTSSCCGFLCVR